MSSPAPTSILKVAAGFLRGGARPPIKDVTAFLVAHRDEFGLRYGVFGAAVGCLFVLKGRYRVVLINYPRAPEKLRITTMSNFEDRQLRDG